MNKEQNYNLEKVFQDIFSKFECTPSQDIWNNIDNELLDIEFKSNLESLEAPTSNEVWNNIISVVETDSLFNQSFSVLDVAPNAENWEIISNTINFDQHFEHSFQDFTQVPNPKIWDTISNNEFETHCRSKFKTFEIEPSDDNWDKIKRAIPAIIPIRALIPHITRVAAIFLIAISIPFLVNKSGLLNKTSNLPVAFNVPTVKVTDTDKIVKTTVNQAIKTSESAQNNIGSTTSNQLAQANTQKESTISSIGSSIVNVVSPPSIKQNLDQAVTFNSQPTTLTSKEDKRIQFATPVTRKTRTIEKLTTSFDGTLATNNNMAFNKLKNQNLNFSSNALSNRTESFVTSLKGPGNSSELEAIKLSDKLFSITDNPRAVKMLNYSGLYVYIASQFSNTWMVNPQVQESLNEYNTANYMVDFGGSAGVGFGFQFSPRVAIEAGWRRAVLNQKFRELVPNQIYVNNDLKSVYNTFETLGKYTLNRVKSNRRNPITTSVALGLHYRNLKNVSMNTDAEFDQSVFINKEVGVTGGFDVDFHLSEWITLAMGARGSIGTDVVDLSSINSESRYNNEYGVRAALQYKISQ